jgi:hypothetical protein
MMKRFILIAILAFPLLGLIFWLIFGVLMRTHSKPPSQGSIEKTVPDRLQEYGQTVRARWKPYFEAKQVPYPPARLTLVGIKEEKRLEVYAAGDGGQMQFLRSYPILAASGVAGPKLREGDKQVPEGIYPVEWLNPNSKYHLAFRIGYPNVFDREQAKLEGRTNLGGDIMIHGDEKSIGCLAMGDPASEDLFVLAADTGISNITVVLAPVDFREGKTVAEMDTLPRWTPGLYETIKAKLNELPVQK